MAATAVVDVGMDGWDTYFSSFYTDRLLLCTGLENGRLGGVRGGGRRNASPLFPKICFEGNTRSLILHIMDKYREV